MLNVQQKTLLEERQWELRRRNLRANQLPQHQVLGGVGVLDEMLLLDERPPATAGSRAPNSAPEGWDTERTAADAP